MNIDEVTVEQVVEEHGTGRDALIPILHAIQAEHKYLPDKALRQVCELTDSSPADVEGVVSFYSQFRRKPASKHHVKVCVGTACHIKGSDRVYDAIQRALGIPEGEDTDSDRMFTVSKVACLGCCTLAPAVQIDDVTYGYQTPVTVQAMLDDFLHTHAGKKTADSLSPRTTADAGEIRIAEDSCCIAGGTTKVRRALEQAVMATGARARVKRVGCVGMCHQIPLVEVITGDGQSRLYAKVQPADAARIVNRHFPPPGPIARIKARITNALLHMLTDEVWEPVTRYSLDVRDAPVCAFLGGQKYIAAEHFGQIDPIDMDEYSRHEGFDALKKVLSGGRPNEIVDMITDSGLRGRGGAGFPTGQKWNIVANEDHDSKTLVMNGDEGDPGAFMDRMLLESYPYRILEGIAIAAYAVGANSAVLYIRSEYPFALRRIDEAIRRMTDANLIGNNILGSGFDLNVKIMQGAGAFVCGEETALLASIEGKRGMPRIRPPYPALRGLNGAPTLINNVETYACVPWIVRNGADAFTALGSDSSNGTKVFSLAGKVVRGGLIEVPMGISISDIVHGIGGGVPEGRTFKAVQIGGPSGGCLPASLGNTLVDYELLADAGAIMGSGGMVVLDDTDCMVDIARYFLQFTQEESCGKCTFCRIGTRRMLEILQKLCEGRGEQVDIELLEELCEATTRGSLCGLGKTAANPVLTTLRYFRDEYEAHVQGRCPALKCEALIRYTVNDNCIGCTRCAQRCPVDAITSVPYEKHAIDTQTCVRCDSCRQACPEDAINVVTGL